MSLMTDLQPYLHPWHEFFLGAEAPKIIMDKGILAAALALFGLYISKSIKIYEALLSTRNDLAKEQRAEIAANQKAEREAAATAQREERDALARTLADERAHSADLQREEREAAAERRRDERDAALQAEKDERERALVPRTQLDLACRFFGPERNKIIADVHLVAVNKGRTIRIFEKVRVRIFTFLEGDVPDLYLSKDGSSRLALRGPQVDEMIDYGFSIEPGITQVFPFTTLIDSRARYVLVKADVETERFGAPGSMWLGEARFMPVRIEARQ